MHMSFLLLPCYHSWYYHSLLKLEVALVVDEADLLVHDLLVGPDLLVHQEGILVERVHSPMEDHLDLCPQVVLPMDNNIELVMEPQEKQHQ